MIPQKLIHTVAKWALGLLLTLAITALAQTILAEEAPRLSVSNPGNAAPDGLIGCATTVLPNDNSTSGNARAPSTLFASSRAVYLIKATELAANGYPTGNTPSSIGWTYLLAPVAGSAPLKIYLQNTTDATYLKGTSFMTAIGPMTLVHNATTSLPGVAGQFDITFQNGTTFTYTGGGLYVAYEWGPYTGSITPAGQLISCNSTGLVGGIAGANSGVDTLAVSSFRPETRLRSTVQNDAAAGPIYSYGELPFGLVPPQAIQGVAFNKGFNNLTNLPVTLNITGAQTFTDMQTIPSLTGCTGSGTATFATFTPSALGSDTVAISVPSDEVNSNNMSSVPISVTSLSYSYKYPGTTAAGGVGFSGAVTMAAKFAITAANAVTDIKLEFPAPIANPSPSYQVAIYGDSAGMPALTPIYQDPTVRNPPVGGGPVQITLPSPVAVPAGNFYVGVQQIGTINFGLGFNNESPLRSGAFFVSVGPPHTSWSDLVAQNVGFKSNVGVLLRDAAMAPLTANSAVSRRTHGAAGNFDINLPLTGSPGIECRGGGSYTVIITFSNNVVSGNASVTGTGSVSGSPTFSANTMTINLTGVTDIQQITVTATNVTDTFAQVLPSVAVPMKVLIGDVSGIGNSTVNSTDVSSTKAAVSAGTVNGSTFRADVNASGTLTATDVSIVKSDVGHMLP